MEPQTITDQPIPLLGGGFSDPTGSDSNDVLGDNFAPTTIKNQTVPTPIVASDTIATSLNTETKSILGEYTFEQLGAIKIGQIEISPKGILGVDLSGNTTFSLDPDTGSCTFSGTILGSTIIGATIETSTSGARVVMDGPGNKISIYNSSGIEKERIDGNLGFGLFGSIGGDANFIYWATSPGGTDLAVLGLDASGNFDIASGVGKNIRLSPGGSVTFDGDLDIGIHNLNNVSQIIGISGRINMNNGNANTFYTRHIDPESANTYNLGGSSRYWFAINYHFLTKQGGFGVFDDGVEMQDGRILSDTEALLAMRPDKVRKEWGKPIFDFDTLPKVIRVYPKNEDNKLVPKNKDGKYIDERGDEHQEGEDVNAMISILIGATRELTTRMKSLEAKYGK